MSYCLENCQIAYALQTHKSNTLSGFLNTGCEEARGFHDALSSTGTSATFLTTLAGCPMTTQKSGTSFVTTLIAPTVTPLPIFTPGKMTTFPPIQQSSPTTTGFPYSMLSRRDCTSASCVAAKMDTLGPNIHRSPIVTSEQSRIVKLKLE